MVALLITCLMMFASVHSHSWLTCPPSFVNTNVGRGGVQDEICENNGANAYVTHVEAGDRLKVGWTSNNHAGGFVRLSLVKYGEHGRTDVSKINVLKFACYGHDTRPFKTRFGDCKHPCNGRPGCQYQSNQYDTERFDTTITIPTNLEDGYYVLQAAMLVGNSVSPYFSCSKLMITRGNPSFNCQSNKPILTYSCLRSGGPELYGSEIQTGTRRGNFCYRLNGELGSIDEYIRDVPINVECDPRLSCKNSVAEQNCQNEEGMNDIMTPNSHPRQPNCQVYTILPDPDPTCNDQRKNRDEEDVDCGGNFCQPCPTVPGVTYEGDYYSGIKVDKGTPWENGAIFKIIISITKNITNSQCWKLSTQFKIPLKIDGQPWGDGMLVEQHSDLKIINFASRPFHGGLTKGGELKVTMQVFNVELQNARSEQKLTEEQLDPLKWNLNPDKLNFLTAFFEVFDKKTDCDQNELVISGTTR